MEAKQFKDWCRQNGAVVASHVRGDTWIVFIRSSGRRYMGMGQSDSLEEAIRFAQLGYDAATLQEVFHAPIVGQA